MDIATGLLIGFVFALTWRSQYWKYRAKEAERECIFLFSKMQKERANARICGA